MSIAQSTYIKRFAVELTITIIVLKYCGKGRYTYKIISLFLTDTINCCPCIGSNKTTVGS